MNTLTDKKSYSPHTPVFEWVSKLENLCEHLLEFASDQIAAAPNLIPRISNYPKMTPFNSGLPYFATDYSGLAPIEWEYVFTAQILLSGPLDKVPNRYMERFPAFQEAFDHAFPIELDESLEGRRRSLSQYRAKEMAQSVVCALFCIDMA